MSFSSMGQMGPLASASRRRFVTGFTAAGILTGLGLPQAFAAALPAVGNANTLSGESFDLTIGETPINITGQASKATTVNGSACTGIALA